MQCPRDTQTDCYFVKTQEQAEKCLLPNQWGARWSCQAQGDIPQEKQHKEGIKCSVNDVRALTS